MFTCDFGVLVFCLFRVLVFDCCKFGFVELVFGGLLLLFGCDFRVLFRVAV